MKMIISLFLLCVLLSVCILPISLADDYRTYEYERPGTVICTQLTVRSSPSTNASEYGKLKNGQTCTILGHVDDWYALDLASCSFKKYSNGVGYVKDSLVVEDPHWIATTKYTYLYTDPWYTNKTNGEQKGRVFLVISENQWYYCVQTRETTAGSSFILKSDVEQYSSYNEYNFVVINDSIPVYDDSLSQQIATLKKFDIVQFIISNGEFYQVKMKDESIGWVQSSQLQRIIN